MTCALPNLYYFDDRPVTEVDRAAALAWETGGIEAEKAVRLEKMDTKQAKFTASCLANAKMTEEKRAARKVAMAAMYAEIKDEKQDLYEEKDKYERELEHMAETDVMKNVVRNKIIVIEEKLTKDYLQSVKVRGDEIPAALAPMKSRVSYT